MKIKRVKNKVFVGAVSVFLIFAVTVSSIVGNSIINQNVDAASLSEIEEQISALENKLREYESAAAKLGAQANSLSVAVKKLQAEQDAIQTQVDISQAKYDQLVLEIKQTEKNIKDNQDALGLVLANKYIESNVTLLERVASSENLSKFVDQETASSVMSDNLSKKVKEIKILKKKLEEQKIEVNEVLVQQKAQRDLLASKKQERQKLLDQTRGQEAAYQQLTRESEARRAELYAEQKRIIESQLGGGNHAGQVGNFAFRKYSGELGCTNYPSSKTGIYGGQYGCNYGLDASIDEWQLYNRECVSYAAYAAYYRFGKRVNGFSGRGNAGEWPDSAPALMGATTNNTPAVGAVAIRPVSYGFPMGHAMVVEAVLSDGWVKVSQFNFAVDGRYSTMEIPASAAVYVHFKNR